MIENIFLDMEQMKNSPFASKLSSQMHSKTKLPGNSTRFCFYLESFFLIQSLFKLFTEQLKECRLRMLIISWISDRATEKLAEVS